MLGCMEQCVHIIFIDVSFSPDDVENTVQGPSCNIRGTINKGIETLSILVIFLKAIMVISVK